MEIRLKNIKKNYGSFEALKGIDLVLEEGKFYGLKIDAWEKDVKTAFSAS